MRQSVIDSLIEKHQRLLEILEGIDSLNSRAKSYCRSYYQFQGTGFNEMTRKFEKKYDDANRGVERLKNLYEQTMTED